MAVSGPRGCAPRATSCIQKFPATVMVLSVVSNKGDVMPPHFFEKGLGVNAEEYVKVLRDVVKPWIDRVAERRPYILQQDSAPAFKAKVTREWMSANLHSHITPEFWPPNSPDQARTQDF